MFMYIYIYTIYIYYIYILYIYYIYTIYILYIYYIYILYIYTIYIYYIYIYYINSPWTSHHHSRDLRLHDFIGFRVIVHLRFSWAKTGGSFHSHGIHGGTPIAGWFISGKSDLDGWELGVTPIWWKPEKMRTTAWKNLDNWIGIDLQQL